MQAEYKAGKLFLQVDAQKRISKALHAKSRPLREFCMGELVYYFRKGPKEGSRYGGHWYGPARVLTHEKTGDFEGGQHLGSVVWVAHAGRIIRCSPEQLRLCAHDLRHLDREINGPQNFHSTLRTSVTTTEVFDSIWIFPKKMLVTSCVNHVLTLRNIISALLVKHLSEHLQRAPIPVDPSVARNGSDQDIPQGMALKSQKLIHDYSQTSIEELGQIKLAVGRKYKGVSFAEIYLDDSYNTWVPDHVKENPRSPQGVELYAHYLRRRLEMEIKWI